MNAEHLHALVSDADYQRTQGARVGVLIDGINGPLWTYAIVATPGEGTLDITLENRREGYRIAADRVIALRYSLPDDRKFGDT